MGDKNDIILKWYEEELCLDNALCAAEMDAKQRGTWFFQMSFLGYKGTTLADKPATITIAGTFEVLQFAPTFKELGIHEEGEDHQLTWRAASIYTKLDLIKNSEAMAFTKMRDGFSTQLAEMRQQKRAFENFKFSLKKFSPNGGVMYKFDLALKSVFILDIQQAAAAEKILITYSNPKFSSETPAVQESEEDELRRVMNVKRGY